MVVATVSGRLGAILYVMVSAKLPPDIIKIIVWLADYARRYGGKLKFNEVDRFKSDLMLRPDRWLPDRVSLAAFRDGCIDAGLSPADTAKLVDFLRRRQSGRRLVVGSRFSRGFTFDGVVAANRSDSPPAE